MKSPNDMDNPAMDEDDVELPPEVEAFTVFYSPENGELTRVEQTVDFENENGLCKADVFMDCRDHFEHEREENLAKWFEICKKRDQNAIKPDPNSNGKGV